MQHSTDCRSDDGIATALVDSIITACRVLRRHYANADFFEAVKDLKDDEDVSWLLNNNLVTSEQTTDRRR